MGHSHTAPAAPGYRFDHNRIANFFCHPERIALVRNDAVAPRRNRYTCFPRKLTSRIFVTHLAHGARRRPDKIDVAAFAHLGEVRVLG